jgi:hypothetical protein
MHRPDYLSSKCSELVLLVGTGLQHVVAQLALEVVEATTTNSRIFFGHCEGAFNLVNG